MLKAVQQNNNINKTQHSVSITAPHFQFVHPIKQQNSSTSKTTSVAIHVVSLTLNTYSSCLDDLVFLSHYTALYPETENKAKQTASLKPYG